jgi:hypothetical protein
MCLYKETLFINPLEKYFAVLKAWGKNGGRVLYGENYDERINEVIFSFFYFL